MNKVIGQDKTMSLYAATSPQLFNQLLAQGYTQEDLLRVHRTYEWARLLYACQITCSGKTQLSHCVGTASVLAFFHAPAHLVAAGLIHNIYSKGDFGDGVYGISEKRRDFLRQTLGQDIEQEVADFANLKWKEENIENFLLEKGPLTRNLVLLHLADILEQHLGGDVLYDHRFLSKRREFGKRITPLVIQAAKALEVPSLVEKLEQAKREIDSPQPLEGLHKKFGHRRTFVLVPPSYRQKMVVKILRVISKFLPRGWQLWSPRPKMRFFHRDIF